MSEEIRGTRFASSVAKAMADKCEAVRSETVERCLACEAVVRKEYEVAGLLSIRALSLEKAGLHDRARIALGSTLRFSLGNHGLASEAALHGLP
jgi:hypothetical protein